jgi:hypothetical protein
LASTSCRSTVDLTLLADPNRNLGVVMKAGRAVKRA